MVKRYKLINIVEWLCIIAAIINILKGEPFKAILFLILSDTTATRYKVNKLIRLNINKNQINE